MAVEIIAEFTTNHLGNPRLLRRMVAAASEAGADSIKMQRKEVGACYSRKELDRPFDSPYGKTYGDYREAFELSRDEWSSFSRCCRDYRIPWFVTAQDEFSLDRMLSNYTPMQRIKISSTNARKRGFVQHVANYVSSEREIVVSVAGQTLKEIERIVNLFRDHRRLWILHCVAEYPCPVERLRLGNIAELRKRFACDQVRIGYSGHEVGYLPTIVAADLGAEMIERHFCMSRKSFGHHIECSLEPDEFRWMVDVIRERTRNGFGEQMSTPLELATNTIPDEAYHTEFGMSEQERPFLENQQYGR